MKNLLISLIAIMLASLTANAQRPNMNGIWIAADNPTPAVYVQQGDNITFTNNSSHVGAGYWVSDSTARLIQTFTAGGCAQDMYLVFDVITINQMKVTFRFLENKCGAVFGRTGQTIITRQAVTNIPVNRPKNLVINQSTNKIYVADSDNNSITVKVIDSVTDTVTATVGMNMEINRMAVNPATNKIYVNSASFNALKVINGATNSVTPINILPNSAPAAMAVNTKTNKIYVVNEKLNSISVVNGANDTVTKTISVGDSPQGIAVNETTNRIYVVNQNSQNVTVIDGATDTALQNPVAVGRFPNGVAVNPATNKIYVLNFGGGSVSVIDGATNNIAATINTGDLPGDAAVNPATNKIYVINGGVSKTVTVIDGATNALTATIPVGVIPGSVRVNPVTNQIFVSLLLSNVLVIDGATNKTTTLAVGAQPGVASINQSLNKIYVTNLSGGSVRVIDGAAIRFPN